MFSLTDLKQDAVLAHIAEVGPLAVNVDASQWHSYTGLHRKLFTFFGTFIITQVETLYSRLLQDT